MRNKKRGFIPYCHDELVSASRRIFNEGFTLLEILVVVLIIGVLTAIAVPQYKRSVIKSRFSTVMPIAKAVADAQEVYFLTNGQYARTKANLDIAVENEVNTDVSLSTADEDENYNYVAAYHKDFPGARYIMYQKHSPKFAGNIHCEAKADDNDALWLCEKGLNGQFIAGGVKGSGYKTYILAGSSTDTFCPTGATCDTTTGEVTACASGYYVKNGVCSSYDYTEDMCYSGCTNISFGGTSGCQSTCNGSFFSEQSKCSEVSCQSATFAGEAECYAADCANSTYAGYSQCRSANCTGGTFKEHSVCEGYGCDAASTTYEGDACCKGCSASSGKPICAS